MEQVLIKLARQLDSLDEASLLMLWEQYAQRVAKFEPSRRWEEAVLVFCLIQAKHWKNQLFNHQLSAHVRPENRPTAERPFVPFSLERPQQEPTHRATVLQFTPKTGDSASIPASAAPQLSKDDDNATEDTHGTGNTSGATPPETN